MNNESKNSSDEQEFTLDYWYSYYGVTIELDILYMYILTTFSLVSFIFNLIVFKVLLKNKFNLSVIYSYFRLYIFNSLLISILLVFTFVGNTYRTFKFTNTYLSLAFAIYVNTPLLSTLYFYSTLLEIIIIIERSERFIQKKYRYLKKFSFNNVCLVTFLFSVILNFPTFLSYYPACSDVQLDDNSTFTVYYWGLSEYSASLFGTILTFTVYFIRDFLFLVLKITLNVYSVYLIRKYLNKIRVLSIIDLNMANSFQYNQNYLTKTDKNLIRMVIIMCIISILENILYGLAFAYYSTAYDIPSVFVSCISLIILAVKHGSNFFVFFLYNNLFRIEFKKELFSNKVRDSFKI
jgi:hypothetical protein